MRVFYDCRMTRRNNPNADRARKRSFQANLKPEENDLVNQVKALRNLTTDRGLLLALCADEIARHEGHASIEPATSQQEFLRIAMKRMGMRRKEFAELIGVKPRTFDNWLLPSNSKEFRKMPGHVRVLVTSIQKP